MQDSQPCQNILELRLKHIFVIFLKTVMVFYKIGPLNYRLFLSNHTSEAEFRLFVFEVYKTPERNLE